MTKKFIEHQFNRKAKSINRLKWFDWIAIGFFALCLFFNAYIVTKRPDLSNSLSSFLFQFLNFIIGIYIAVRITVASERDNRIEVQKTIAKTSIRQIRSSQRMIERLMRLIGEKGKSLGGKKKREVNSAFDNINAHLADISLGLTDSENAFRDILDEEFKEENEIVTRVFDKLELALEKNKELKEIHDKRTADSVHKIRELETEIAKIRNEIAHNISALPLNPVASQNPLSAAARIRSSDNINFSGLATAQMEDLVKHWEAAKQSVLNWYPDVFRKGKQDTEK